MKMRIILAVFALVLSTSFPHLAINMDRSIDPAVNSAVTLSQPVVSIDPNDIKIQLIDDFEVNINVANVINLHSFDITLSYDENCLAYLNASAYDSLLVGTNATYSKYFGSKLGGKVKLELHLNGDAACNGSGTLVTVKFQGIKIGSSKYFTIDPKDSTLKNSTHDTINFDLAYGTVSVSERTITKEIYEDYALLANVHFRYDYLFKVMANDVVLDLNNHTISAGADAITIDHKSGVTIKNGSIVDFQVGVDITESDQINIFNVTVLNSRETAIRIVDSTDVHVCNSTVSNSTMVTESIQISNSNFTEISHNVLSNNKFFVIKMKKNSSNNTISYNTISNNTPGGISIDSSNNNTIFNNNFINNKDYAGKTYHVKSDAVSINAWNWSYPHGGNYWDDWNATTRQSPKITDEKSGENQTILGPDGIGDTPYSVDDTNQFDGYPLLNPLDTVLHVRDVCKMLMEANKTRTLSVAVYTNSSVADLNFDRSIRNEGLISFNVSGNCTSCKVIVSKELLDGAFKIKVDEIPVDSSLDWDEGYIFANFNHSSGNHQVEICGETVRRCDLNNDGKVNIVDIALIAKELGYVYNYEKPD